MSSEKKNINIIVPDNIKEEIRNLFSMQELLAMGLHFGSKYSEPKMRKNYIYCRTNGLNIFNLEKTSDLLYNALEKIYSIIASGKSVIIICTKKNSSSQLLKDMAESCGQYYISSRWMPGILTNRETLKKTMEKIELLKVTLTKTNKPNRSKRIEATELHKRQLKVEGINNCNLDNIGAVVSIFCDNLGIVAHECHKTGVPLIAVCDSDTKDHILEKVNYVIPANDDGMKSIYLYLRLITHVARKGLEELYTRLKQTKENQDDSAMGKLLKDQKLAELKNKEENKDTEEVIKN
jgi:small subunit ribosomal protein S2